MATGVAPTTAAAQQLTCDLSGYSVMAGFDVRSSRGAVTVEWEGADDQQLRLAFGLADGAPIIEDLSMRARGGDWTLVAADASFEFKIVEGLRRTTNQQLVPLRGLDVELTQEVVDRYKWDVFWDAPLDLREPIPAKNPPPIEGVADQPGLPRPPAEIRRADAEYTGSSCVVTREGRRLAVAFPGMRLGSFSGALVASMHLGTNLVRVEAVASTDRPSVAYKYDFCIIGLDLAGARVHWRDVANQMQSYALSGPANDDDVALRAANPERGR